VCERDCVCVLDYFDALMRLSQVYVCVRVREKESEKERESVFDYLD